MFWRVRGYGRKGFAFQAISGLDVALWDLKGKALGVPSLQTPSDKPMNPYPVTAVADGPTTPSTSW